MTKVIFIQGPPRSGKDTVGEILRSQLRRLGHAARVYKFADPIADWSESFFGVSCRDEAIKDERHHNTEGKTPREVAIAFSERAIKPVFGHDIFGKVLSRKIAQGDQDFAIITDSGFPLEAAPIYRQVGLTNCVALQLERDGTSFVNDSRDYWELPAPGRTTRFRNVGSMSNLLEDVCSMWDRVEPV